MAQVPSTIIPQVLYVPSTLARQGTGHLRRCREAVRAGNGEAALWLCTKTSLLGGRPFSTKELESWSSEVRTLDVLPDGRVFPLVVVDFQKTPRRLLAWLHERAQILVGWDEGGAGRHRFPYLVDTLPHQTEPEPNVRMPGLLGLPELRDPTRFHRPVRKVLISFGGSDSSNLTVKVLRLLQRHDLRRRWSWEVTVIRGPFAKFAVPQDVRVVDAPATLEPWLTDADLVITSWGLTALESLAAGTSVVTLNPTEYHDKLARRAGLVSLGVKRLSKRRLEATLTEVASASARAASQVLAPPLPAHRYFATLTGTVALCPVCRTSGHPVFARTTNKSFHRCRTCSMEFLSVYQLPPKVYSDAYFFEDYQSQYGKTYLEDFPHIEDLGRQRLEFLRGHLHNRLPSQVLDVGCAYGPFLSAAVNLGIQPFGVDIADSAVRHVREVLGYPAVAVSWLDFQWDQAFPGQKRPDLLSMWYVIEHFPDLHSVLTQVSRTLAPGGIFAFGTPNGRGLTRRFRGQKFWIDSPDDHFSVWNRASARKVLARYGLEILGFRNTGLHPQRFPGLDTDRGWRFRAVRYLGSKLGWGDTFEVYARKVRELA